MHRSSRRQELFKRESKATTRTAQTHSGVRGGAAQVRGGTAAGYEAAAAAYSLALLLRQHPLGPPPGRPLDGADHAEGGRREELGRLHGNRAEVLIRYVTMRL
jgi:hypothetical protein